MTRKSDNHAKEIVYRFSVLSRSDMLEVLRKFPDIKYKPVYDIEFLLDEIEKLGLEEAFIETLKEVSETPEKVDRDMTKEEAIKKKEPCEDRKNCPHRHENGNCLSVGGFCLAVDNQHCQLKKEPCEDTISRQEVLEQTYNWSKDEFLRVTNPFDYLRKRINALPPVQPIEKCWELRKEKIEQKCDKDDWYKINYYCIKCDFKIGETCHKIDGRMFGKSTVMKDNKFPICCPHCGAKMEEGEEHENS